MADKIAVLRAGRVEQFGRPLDLFNRPANRFVAGFIGSPAMNFLPGRVQGSAVTLADGTTIDLPDRFSVRNDQQVDIGIRAGDLQQTSGPGLSAKVTSVEQLGAESYLYCRTMDDVPLTLHQPGQTSACKGDRITLGFDPDGLHLFDRGSGQTCRIG